MSLLFEKVSGLSVEKKQKLVYKIKMVIGEKNFEKLLKVKKIIKK